MKILKEAFVELKNRIGRVPYLYDFVLNHSIDPVVIVERYSNYQQFLLKMKEEVSTLTSYENKVLTMLSLEVLNGKREHEIILLDLLLHQEKVEYLNYLAESNCQIDDDTMASVRRIFDLSFSHKHIRSNMEKNPLFSIKMILLYLMNRS